LRGYPPCIFREVIAMKKYRISGVELDRLKILSDVLNGKLTLKEASQALHLSYRQAIRLKKKVKEQGIEGLLKKAPPKPPNLKITQELKQVILSLRKEVYSELNLLHFRDKLIELHNIHISYESLRQILIKEGGHEPKRKRRIHRRRWRMPKAGLLVQMDSSLHAWIEDIPGVGC
jgi:transposase